MFYEIAQTALTHAIEAIAIVGLGAIFVDATIGAAIREVRSWGTPHSTLFTGVDTEVLPPLESSDICLPEVSCPIDPDAHWDESEPDGSAWEYASPLTCEWIAPAVAETPVTRKPRTRKPAQPQSSLAQELGLTPPLGWGQVQQTATRKPATTKKSA